jgi:hypothetical protein
MGGLFGSKPKAPEAFRAPGFETQGELLNLMALAPFATPEFIASQPPEVQEQLRLVGQFAGMTPSFDPGQAIAGQIGPTTDVSQLQPFQQTQFQERAPFQFGMQFDPRTAVGQAFEPAFAAAAQPIERRGELERQAILEDLNQRGLLTAGATTESLFRQREQERNLLGNISSQLAAEQARQQLGAAQFGAGLGFQTQQAQAAELFRQQGASDAQAQFLAQQAMAQRQQQLGAQQQQFQQMLGGRQAALGEFGLQTALQQAPRDELFRLFQLSSGPTPGQQGSPGLFGNLFGGLAQAGGAAAGGAIFCLPKGTEIEKEGLETVKVEDIQLGDSVEGGTVIGLTKIPRQLGHKFANHRFKVENDETVEILMTNGHPYYDEIDSIEYGIDNESEHTYDILTTTGCYYVKGIKLGSTIRGVYNA